MARSPRRKTLETARRPTSSANRLAGRKILLVDDDPAQIRQLRRTLAHHGYQLLEAHDGSEALTSIRQGRPDLIVMDVEMPGMGGVEVCRIVKANQDEAAFGFIPVLLMTAGRKTSKVESLDLGADDYLAKPFDPLELSARVRSMLRLKSLHDALLEKNHALDQANQELDRKRQELLELSRTDPLTGLSNRRYFEERYTLEFARSNRYRSPLSCLMLDIDHFKKTNDTYGHAFGDRALKEVARAAGASLRDVDLLARYGGEELVALLPETGPQQALLVAERVREGVAELRLPVDLAAANSPTAGCTVSIGVATFPAPGIDDAEGLLRASDDCLYAAKKAGRNRVVQHEE